MYPTLTPTGGWRAQFPMLLCVLACAAAALLLARTPAAHQWGLGPLALAMLGGLLLAQPLPQRPRQAGQATLTLFKGPILKLAIVLYGLRMPLEAVRGLGLGVFGINLLQILASLLLALWLGRYWLGLDRRAALIVGLGNGICGAAAVLAAEPVLGSRARDTAMATAAVVIFGTLNMLCLPLLYHHLPTLLEPRQYAMLAGANVQEVAQVIVAAQAMDPALVDLALLVKMERVILLAPTLLLLSLLPRTGTAGEATPRRLRMPQFPLWFLAALAINALGLVPPPLAGAVGGLDDLLLALAMAALGLSIHHRLLRQAGWRPLLLGALLWLTTLGLVLTALKWGLAG